jgi:hypothetical protein
MAEIQDQNNNQDQGNKGDQGSKGQQGKDTISISKAEFERLQRENSDLVQEVTAKKKELNDKLEAERKAKDEELKAKGEFKSLAEQRGQEIDALNKRIKDQQVDIALREEARKAGLNDFDTLVLVDRSKIELTDAGQVKGADEAIKNFKKAKPSFFGSQQGGGAGGLNNADMDRLNGIDLNNLKPEDIDKLPREERRQVIEQLRGQTGAKMGSAFTRARQDASKK